MPKQQYPHLGCIKIIPHCFNVNIVCTVLRVEISTIILQASNSTLIMHNTVQTSKPYIAHTWGSDQPLFSHPLSFCGEGVYKLGSCIENSNLFLSTYHENFPLLQTGSVCFVSTLDRNLLLCTYHESEPLPPPQCLALRPHHAILPRPLPDLRHRQDLHRMCVCKQVSM